jgi:hypothetical protein
MMGSNDVNVPGTSHINRDDPEWARRHAANVRLALAFGAIAVLVFALALWKFRPF